MNTWDDNVERSALDFHRTMWPVHTGLRTLRMFSLGWIAPRIAGLARHEKWIVSGAMTILRCSTVPLIVGAAIRLATPFIPIADPLMVTFAGNAVAGTGLVMMTLALSSMLALRLRHSVFNA